MNLLGAVLDYLNAHEIKAAAIGGVALAAHGIVRATLDADVLVTDPHVLHAEFWAGLSGARAEARSGDVDDPLAGVVHLVSGAEEVDVVVGRYLWQTRALERAVILSVGGRPLPTVDRADLVLLKLFAGGPQDLLDVQLLLAADRESTVRAEVEARIRDLPAEVSTAWGQLKKSPL
jgi:hypothetical protein